MIWPPGGGGDNAITTTTTSAIFGPFQQGLQPLLPPGPFLPFHSISDQTLVHFSPKNVFVQILVKIGDFFVWKNDQKKLHPPICHTQQ
jgi:hypothetical protein